jgi:CRISPR system Cascade subunit CasB
LADVPEALASWDGVASAAEQAIHLSLTLFALHQQGKTQSVSHSGVPFGKAVRKLVAPDKSNEQTIKRRFDAALTAKDLVEFSQHARGLVQLMKANDVFMDYPVFAENLYWYQDLNWKNQVMFKWGTDFWMIAKKEQDKEESQEEDREKSREEGVRHE